MLRPYKIMRHSIGFAEDKAASPSTEGRAEARPTGSGVAITKKPKSRSLRRVTAGVVAQVGMTRKKRAPKFGATG